MRIWLKKFRESTAKTHEQVADEAGISRSYYTNIESGAKTPTVSVAKAIAKSLKFPWGLFFEEERSFKEHSGKEVG